MLYTVFTVLFFADEIVDSFHGFNKEELINDFEKNIINHLKGISLNHILNSFQCTVKEYNITDDLIQAFKMKLDLVKSDYSSTEEYNEYIYGSADVVGLMCLKVL
jgi:phytoene/squalene synthetase